MLQPIDYDRIASECARNRQVHPLVLSRLLSGGQVGEASRVLEVGCGTGNYILAVQALTGCDCWGTDPSSEMLARAAEHPQTIDLRPGRAEKFDYPAAPFQ